MNLPYPTSPLNYGGSCPYMAFYLLASALEHRAIYGGWIFQPTCKNGLEGPVFWFNIEFTPSAIMSHPLTKGFSGKVI